MEVENLIRNIVSEVTRECKNHKISADATFITYYVKLLNLDPNRGISEDVMKVRENIQAFIKFVVTRLQQQKEDPKIVTLKLQHHLNEALKSIPNAVTNYRKDQERTLTPLQLAIVEPKEKCDIGLLYRRIAQYIILISRMGNPNNEQVFKETYQAVQSVMNLDEVKAFCDLQNYIRQEVLDSVVKVTSGVKLFNKYCNKGGREIPNLPEMLSCAMEAVKIAVQDILHYYEIKCTALTKLINKFMIANRITEDELVWEIKKGMDEKDFHYARDLLVSHKQLVSSLRSILSVLNNVELKMDSIYTEYIETLKQLKEIVIPSIHQSVDQLFPLFTYLCDLWMQLQDVVIELKEIKQIFSDQTGLLKSLSFEKAFINHEQEYPMHSGSAFRTPTIESKGEEMSEKGTIDFSKEFGSDELVSKPVKESDHIIERNGTMVIRDEYFRTFIESTNKLDYGGYCCWSLVHSGGALILGNPDLGVVNYKHRFFVFQNTDAANAFTKNPAFYVKKMIQLTRENVELIHFLQVEKDLIHHQNMKVLVQKTYKKRDIQNKDIQVETHITESNFEHSYKWNIWDHRRKAEKMVQLLRCSTVGTMTTKCSYNSSASTQTYESKEVDSQTKKDNYCNTFKRQHYIYGLRGRKDDKQFAMELVPSEFSPLFKEQ